MKPSIFRNAFERGDLASDTRGRSDARPCRHSIDDHCACSALTESATKSRTLKSKIVAQDVEQRSRRIDVQGVRFTVHLQCDVAHYRSPYTNGLSGLQV